MSPTATSSPIEGGRRGQSSSPIILSITNLPGELIGQIIDATHFNKSEQVASLHLVSRAWRAHLLDNLESLRPKNIHDLPLFGPRFSNTRYLIIDQKACDRSWQLFLRDRIAQNNFIRSRAANCTFGRSSRVSLNLIHLTCFNQLVHLNVAKNRFIDDRSFASLKYLPSLRSLNAANCNHLKNLCDLRESAMQVFNFSGCRSLSALGVQRISQCHHLRSLNLAYSRASKESFEFLSSLTELVDLNLRKKISVEADYLTSLSTLSNLKTLKLENICDLWAFESLFSSLAKLHFLSLKSSTLDNAALKGMSRLSNLSSIDLSSTNFIAIKGLNDLRSLSRLQEMILDRSQYLDLKQLTTLTQLRRLKLRKFTSLEGNNFTSLSKLRGLEFLDLSDCKIPSLALEVIGGFKKMTYLRASCRSAQRCGTKEFGLPDLKYLNLRNWRVNRTWLAGLANSKRITHLNLSKSSVKNCDIEFLVQLQMLTHLNLNGCFGLTENGLKSLGALSRLKHLYLSKTQVIWKEVGLMTNLRKLETLDLSFCQYVDSDVFRSIAKLERLRVLNLQSTSVTSLIEINFADLAYLRDLNLSSCRFHKRDILSLFEAKGLKHLKISINSSQMAMAISLRKTLHTTKVHLFFNLY